MARVYEPPHSSSSVDLSLESPRSNIPCQLSGPLESIICELFGPLRKSKLLLFSKLRTLSEKHRGWVPPFSIPTKSAAYKLTFRSRNALAITETELKLIAALAIIGLSNQPNTGYSTPA